MRARWIVLFCVLGGFPLAGAQEVRTWTSASGKTLEAAFVENRFGQVILRKADGEQIRINLNQLSSADQIFVGSQGRIGGSAGARPGAGMAAEAPVPPELEDLFGKRLIDAKGKKVSAAMLAGKKIGLYFTASWCPPCRAFTPQLVAAYHQLKTDGKPFEVVLVTSDQNEAAMEKYMKDYDMPFVAVPFGDKHIDALKKKFSVSGIPKLVVIDDAGKTLSADARGAISQKGSAAFDEW